MAVNRIRQADLKALGFLLQNDKEHFAVRFLGRAGNFTSQELANINYIADTYGRGYSGITTRLQIEVPWIHNDDVENVIEDAKRLGLRHGGTGKKVRPLVACKGTVCLHGNIDTQDLCRKLEEVYFATDQHSKFKLNVVGCPNNCAKANINDIGIMGKTVPQYVEEKCVGCGLCVSACRQKALELKNKKIIFDVEKCVDCGGCVRACRPGGFIAKEKGADIFVGGRFGRAIRIGDSLGQIFKEEDIIPTVEIIMGVYKELGESGERLSKTIERVGADTFISKVKERI